MGKKKYWDLYCDMYPIITDKSGGDFPQKFAENFVEAYEREISEYQRGNGSEEYLRETVVLDESEFSPDDSLSDQ